MSIYRFRAGNDNTLRIRTSAGSARIWASIGTPDGDIRGLHIPNADAPTVAAELLKAAGHHYLAGYIEGGIDVQERAEKAEAEAAEKKLQERRDALAKKYHGLDFVHIGEGGQRVINDIIELQDKLDGASRD